MHAKAKLGDSEIARLRSSQRRFVNIAAHAREERGQPMQVRISDLSTDGCAIVGDFHFEQATCIWIKMPGISARRARIVWSRHGSAGCEFESRLAESLIDEVSEVVGRAVAARNRRSEAAALPHHRAQI
jgi:hypothetical protein